MVLTWVREVNDARATVRSSSPAKQNLDLQKYAESKPQIQATPPILHATNSMVMAIWPEEACITLFILWPFPSPNHNLL